MVSFRTIRVILVVTILVLAFCHPMIVIFVPNAVALYGTIILQSMAESFKPTITEDSLPVCIVTSILHILSCSLQIIFEILEEADQLATTTTPGFKGAPFLHSHFKLAIGKVCTAYITVQATDAITILQHVAINLQSIADTVRHMWERGVLFQGIMTEAMARVMGVEIATRLVACAHVVLFGIQYLLVRVILSFSTWCLRCIYKLSV